MKSVLRLFRDTLLTPFYVFLFYVLPLKLLAFIVGFVGNENEALRIKILRHFIGEQLSRAVGIYNKRLARLPYEERRLRAREVWQSETAHGYCQRAFKDPESRCSAYAYDAVHDLYGTLNRPLRVLELGCANASSYHCLQFRSIDIETYCGIDINERMIEEAKGRYHGTRGLTFHCRDFFDHLKSETDTYDILLVKQVFFHLDQDYLEAILDVLSEKRLVERIVFQEKVLKDHKARESAIMNLGFSPITYSHNYDFLLKKYEIGLESGGFVDFSSSNDVMQFLAVTVLSKGTN